MRVTELAVKVFGEERQKAKAIEELAELTDSILKHKDGRRSNDGVATEIADVIIMAEQLAIIYGEEKVREAVEYKEERLKERILQYLTNELQHERKESTTDKSK